MKILLILALFLTACNSNSNQIKIYEDSAKMCLDSFVKYKAPAVPLSDSAELVRKNLFLMYKTMYDYYTEEANKLK